jgi:glutamyl-tRNA synthetase
MIRTRFAPSPTGFLHIGGLRTALFAYLFAKKNEGRFILRIEDTDQSREIAGAKEKILADLAAVGILPDESYHAGGDFGPYIQSQRIATYQKKIEELLEKKNAYRCFCSPERLEQMRLEQKKRNLPPRYDGSCRKLSDEQITEKLQNKIPHTIRLKMKRIQGKYIVSDLLRGKVSFQSSQIDDQVLLKSDGFPTYHLACVVDDHLMKITHVIRGEEWLPSTPKHLQLYEYFGWEPPQFIHLPLLLAADRSKLSKRKGDVGVEDYLKKGFLKQALINFIALLGWNPGDHREIFSLEELITNFSVERLGKSGAIFDLQKLQWMNQQYIRKLSYPELKEKTLPFLNEEYRLLNAETLQTMLVASQNNLSQLDAINEELEDFRPQELDEETKNLLKSEQNQKLLQCFFKQIQASENWQQADFSQVMKELQKELGIKGKELWLPIRLALTAKKHGPELPVISEILGKKFCSERIAKLIKA